MEKSKAEKRESQITLNQTKKTMVGYFLKKIISIKLNTGSYIENFPFELKQGAYHSYSKIPTSFLSRSSVIIFPNVVEENIVKQQIQANPLELFLQWNTKGSYE